jgi:hypothetical protein
MSGTHAGMSRVAFLMNLGNYKVCPFSVTAAELEQDIKNA